MLDAAGWREVFFWLGAINLAVVPVIVLALRREAAGHIQPARDIRGLAVPEAACTRGFWFLLSVFALCAIQDFFVSVYVVAFALDEGVGAPFPGNLLVFIVMAGLVGVLLAGVWSDKVWPAWPTAACFLLRIVIFGIISMVEDPALIAGFALLFGLAYWVTAPLTVIFVRGLFGARNLVRALRHCLIWKAITRPYSSRWSSYRLPVPCLASGCVKRRRGAFQEVDDAIGEHVILVARHHVRRILDVHIFRMGNLL